MEALTAVAIALLTAYDMLKGIDPAMRIDGIRLLHKSGGQSGRWDAPDRDSHAPPPPDGRPDPDTPAGASPP